MVAEGLEISHHRQDLVKGKDQGLEISILTAILVYLE